MNGPEENEPQRLCRRITSVVELDRQRRLDEGSDATNTKFTMSVLTIFQKGEKITLSRNPSHILEGYGIRSSKLTGYSREDWVNLLISGFAKKIEELRTKTSLSGIETMMLKHFSGIVKPGETEDEAIISMQNSLRKHFSGEIIDFRKK